MSKAGKLARGKKWYSMRIAVEAREYKPFKEFFLPEGIVNDENKMKDINYFLAQDTPKKEAKPSKKEVKKAEVE